MEGNFREPGLSEPYTVIIFTPGRTMVCLEEHHRVEDEREGRPRSLIVHHEVIDDERPSLFQGSTKLSEYGDIVGGSLLVSHVGVDPDVVLGRTEVEGVEIAIDGSESFSDPLLCDEVYRDLVHVFPVDLS